MGPNGLLNQLTATVLEAALEAKMDEHLGYEKYQAEGRDGGNPRKRAAGEDRAHRDRAGHHRGAPRHRVNVWSRRSSRSDSAG